MKKIKVSRSALVEAITTAIAKEIKEGNDDLQHPFNSSRITEVEKVEDKVWELVEAIESLGESTPDLVDAYVLLLRTLKKAGVNLDRLVLAV